MSTRGRSWMKALGLLAILAVLAGCGSDGTTLSSSGGGGGTLGTAAVNSTTIIYAANKATNGVRSATVSQTTGILTAAGGLSFPTTVAAQNGATDANGGVALHPTRDAVYFVNNDSASVSEMDMRSDGTFTDCAAGCTPLGTGAGAVVDLAIHPSGTFLYALGTAQITVFSIASNNGLSRVAVTGALEAPNTGNSIVINSAGTFAFVSDTGTSQIRTYQLLSNGLVNHVAVNSAVDAPTNPRGLIFSNTPRPNTLYVPADSQITAWAVGTNGILTRIAARDTSANNTALALNAAGDRLLATDSASRLLVIEVSSAGIPGLQLSTFNLGGAGGRIVTTGSGGNRVIVANTAQDKLDTFLISGGSGVITREATFDTPGANDPTGLAIREP